MYSLIAAHLATLALNWQEDSSVRIQKVKLEEDIKTLAEIMELLKVEMNKLAK